jgi:multidrug efflux pump subunit AcrA (membrane-fusion protein)
MRERSTHWEGMPTRRGHSGWATVLLAGFSGLASSFCTRGTAEDAKAGAKAVSAIVVPVEPREIRRNVEAVGSLFPYEEVTVSAEVEGKVEQVLVDVGDRVGTGQPLVRVAPVELQLALERQKAAMRQAQARLGLSSEEDDLADPHDAPEVTRAAAALTEAEHKLARAQSLSQQGLLPGQDLEDAEVRLKSARAAYDLALQSIENLRAQMAEYRASLALANKKLNDSVIRAPFGGRIKERGVTQGQFLRVQTPVMVVVSLDRLRARLKVPEKAAASVHVGQKVSVSVEAYPDRRFEGEVSRINPSVDPETRAFEVEALLENREDELKPGFFAKATIASDSVERAIFVPADALQYVYGVYKVFAVQDGKLRETEVKLGEREGDRVEVAEGLTAGESVAIPVRGQELRDGAPVEAVRAETGEADDAGGAGEAGEGGSVQ